MKHARLVWVNLTRNKRRTVLTMASIAVALFLFVTLRSVITTLAEAVEVGSEARLITRSATSIVFFLPQTYYDRIRVLEGVKGASWANWFGGEYGDGRTFFAQFAVDAGTYFSIYPEYIIPSDQLEAFRAERTAAIVGPLLMEKFGWKLGQTITLRGTIFPGDWPLVIRGVYRVEDPSFGEDTFFLHYDYVYERYSRWVEPGWFVVRLADPALAPAVSEKIDAMYKNSRAATKTETERAFQASFMTMWGNIGLLLRAIGTAIFFAILLVAGNTMIMAERERTNEVAIMKTLGYGDRLLFGLVLAEASVIAVGGGALGIFGAKILFEATNFRGAGFLPGFHVQWATVWIGLAISAGLGLASGAIPAWQAARLPVAQALRQVA